MKVIFDNKGTLIPDTYAWIRNDPIALAGSLRDADIVRVLAACEGDTSKLHFCLRQAIAIKVGIMLQKQEEFNERRKEEYKQRSAAFHKQIMDEIRQLSCGVPFTATSIQIAAAKTQTFPVRSWQMYHMHLNKALREGEPVKRDDGESQMIVYILKNGKERMRHIGRLTPSIWSFTD